MSEHSGVDAVEYVFQEGVLKLIVAVVVGFLGLLLGIQFLVAANTLLGLIYAVCGAALIAGGGVALLYKVISDSVSRDR